jgi:hypothetical protein
MGYLGNMGPCGFAIGIAVRKLGYKCRDVSKTLGVGAAPVSKAVSLGSSLAESKNSKTIIALLIAGKCPQTNVNKIEK